MKNRFNEEIDREIKDVQSLLNICLAVGTEEEAKMGKSHEEIMAIVRNFGSKLQRDQVSLTCAKAVLAGDKRKLRIYRDMINVQARRFSA